MLTWQAFAGLRPDMAQAGYSLLYQFGIGMAFLATVRKDGGPRLHPVCPLIHDGHLFVFVVGNSPKRYVTYSEMADTPCIRFHPRIRMMSFIAREARCPFRMRHGAKPWRHWLSMMSGTMKCYSSCTWRER